MKHEFALFTEQVAHCKPNQAFEVNETTMIHRITHVLRLKSGDTLILFDRKHHAHFVIDGITKKSVRMTCRALYNNQMLQPEIHWLLPILERDAFETAFYSLAAMGATTITPIITDKSRKKWGTQKDYDRVQRIVVAAAEQAKHFAMPFVKPVQNLFDATQAAEGEKLFFDVGGQSALTKAIELSKARVSVITCSVGPEGDLTLQEKELLKIHGFSTCLLTPTVLRACDAVTVGMGIMRSCIQRDA